MERAVPVTQNSAECAARERCTLKLGACGELGGRWVCGTEPLVNAKSRAEGCVCKKGVALRLPLAGSPAEMERGGFSREALGPVEASDIWDLEATGGQGTHPHAHFM